MKRENVQIASEPLKRGGHEILIHMSRRIEKEHFKHKVK